MARTKQASKPDSSKRPGKHPSKAGLKAERPAKGSKLVRKQPKLSGEQSASSSKLEQAGTSDSESQAEASEAEADEPQAEDAEKAPRKWSRLTLFKRRVRKAQQQLNDGHALLNEQAAVRCVQTAIHRSELASQPIRLKISAVRTIHDIVDTCVTQIFSHAHDIVKQSKHSQLNDQAVALSVEFWSQHNDLGVMLGANEILESEFQGATLLGAPAARA